MVGGTGFIVSSFLFMLETQTRWYRPKLDVLGWHIGFWNLVGALGFTLCGALGFGSSQAAVEYAASLSTFVGSWAFLVRSVPHHGRGPAAVGAMANAMRLQIASLIQWYESLDKYPISTAKVATRLQTDRGG